MSGKVSLGSVLSLTYSQFVSDRLTMGLEAGYNPLHQGLSYSVGAKYGDGAGFLGSEEGGVTCRRHCVVDEADGGLVHEEGLEENTTRLETRCGLQQPHERTAGRLSLHVQVGKDVHDTDLLRTSAVFYRRRRTRR